MYKREIQGKRPSPVENGVPIQGTWDQAFEEVDLLSVHKPYSAPLPGVLKNFRLKEWESFYIQNDRFNLQAHFWNLKFYRTALVTMYNMETKERLSFRKIIPGGAWRLPRGLYNASVDSHSYGFFFRIHSWLDTESISLELNIKETRSRPAFTAYVTFNLAEKEATPMAVSLLFSEHRSMYAYKALAAVEGNIVSGGHHIHFDSAKTSGLFCDFKGYYPYRMRSTWCSAMAFDDRNRRFGFALGENQARETYKNNENALWIDGRLTPLPPVKITRIGGPEPEWIIQDMEGMVDLVFTQKAPMRYSDKFIFLSSDYEDSLGYFNGLLVSAEGEELPVRNAWGTGEKLYLRV